MSSAAAADMGNIALAWCGVETTLDFYLVIFNHILPFAPLKVRPCCARLSRTYFLHASLAYTTSFRCDICADSAILPRPGFFFTRRSSLHLILACCVLTLRIILVCRPLGAVFLPLSPLLRCSVVSLSPSLNTTIDLCSCHSIPH